MTDRSDDSTAGKVPHHDERKGPPLTLPGRKGPPRPDTGTTDPDRSTNRPPDDPPPQQRTIGYEELAVQISTDGDGELQGQVVRSPFGNSRPYPIRIALSDRKLTDLLTTLEYVAPATDDRATREVDAEVATSQPEVLDVDAMREEYALPLSESLFPGNVSRYLTHGLAEVADRMRSNRCQGLRIRLMFDANPGIAAPEKLNLMMALPWDLLTDDTNGGQFLCRCGSYAYTPLVYSLGNWDPPARRIPVVTPPLRVLLVLQSVVDFTELDLAKEVRRIQQGIAGTETVAVRVLAAPSLEQLRWELANHEIHAVHFVGHGNFDDETKEGYLGFELADGQRAKYSARQIAAVVRQAPSLRLVVFGACLTARADWNEGNSAYLTMAGALYQAGVPAIVAMRYPIYDDAAIRFSAELYAALAAGDPIDAAVAEARAALPEGPFEWVTPVLFLGASDGTLFDLRQPGARQGDPLRIGLQSFQGWGEQLTRTSDRVLSLLPSFDRRYLRDPAEATPWNAKIFPQMRRFLAEAAYQERPIHLEMQAHQTLAFTAGYLLEAKSGLDIAVRQRGITGTSLWRAAEGEIPEGACAWKPFTGPSEDLIQPDGRDLAVAVGLTRPVETAVRRYLETLQQSQPNYAVRRLLCAHATACGQTAVRNGAHAAELARSLAEQIDLRPFQEAQRPNTRTGEPGSTLHLFAAAPNIFLFYLGQMARTFGRIQLYEFQLDQEGGTYIPSMVLSPQMVNSPSGSTAEP